MHPRHTHNWERLDQGDAVCASCGVSLWRQNPDLDEFPYSRVLVTGGGGFLGRVIVGRLQTYERLKVFAPARVVRDLTQPGQAELLLHETQPDLIIHLAAVVGGIGKNKANPGSFFYDNLIMGAQLMEAARRAGTQKFVALGTVCSYPKFAPVPFHEEDLWNGYPEETNAPYGLAKKMMLVQSQAYREQYGFNSIFLLPANLYGPGDNFDLESSHVIPALIRKCVEAKREGRAEIELWGSGDASREFLYVGDCAEGVLRAAKFYDESDPVNLGTGREISIRELAEVIVRLTNFSGGVRWRGDGLDGQPRRQLDCSRAAERFRFRASVDLESGLRETVRWYEAQL